MVASRIVERISFCGHRPLVQEPLHHLVIVHAQRVEHLVPGRLGLGLVSRRNRAAHDLFAVVAREGHSLHGHQVDDALEALRGAHVHLDRHDVQAELLPHIPADPLRVGAGTPVHLVDERNPRHAVPLHLLIDGEGLALHAADGAQDHDRSIEHAERPLDLDSEVHVAGRIDQVDALASPRDLRGGRLDRDAVRSRSRSMKSMVAPPSPLPSWTSCMR